MTGKIDENVDFIRLNAVGEFVARKLRNMQPPIGKLLKLSGDRVDDQRTGIADDFKSSPIVMPQYWPECQPRRMLPEIRGHVPDNKPSLGISIDIGQLPPRELRVGQIPPLPADCLLRLEAGVGGEFEREDFLVAASSNFGLKARTRSNCAIASAVFP